MHILHTDGGSRGNPGPAAIGYLLYDDQMNLVASEGAYLGDKITNNAAEYNALISGLQLAIKHGVKELTCKLDSELVVKQVRGEYRVKHPEIKPLYLQVMELTHSFKEVKFQHVLREFNKAADKIVNEVLDAR